MSKKIDPRIIRTQEAIFDAFLQLYQTKQVKDITIRDITQEAGVNRATFYKHYQDKFDLFDQIVGQCFSNHLVHYVPTDALLDAYTFRQLIYATILFIKDWQPQRNLAIQDTDVIIETRIQQIIFDRIMFWIEPNYLKGPCEAGTEVVATAVSWAVFGVGLRLSEQKADIPADDVTDELVKVLAGGLWNSLLNYHTHAQHILQVSTKAGG